MADRIGVLFVCLGNICRSPLAEGVFAHLVDRRGLEDRFDIDSAGTGHWHVGEPADRRSIAVGRKHGIAVSSIARQVDPELDRERFKWLIAMDQSNAADLLSLGFAPERIRLMRSFDPSVCTDGVGQLDVPDPYYGPGDGFERNYAMLDAACAGLLDHLFNTP